MLSPSILKSFLVEVFEKSVYAAKLSCSCNDPSGFSVHRFKFIRLSLLQLSHTESLYSIRGLTNEL